MLSPTSIAKEAITTDALIIGAGPAGLFAAFQLGLHGLQSHIVDTLPFIGGQCVQLYGDKLIYDIPAIKQCTGQELAQQLLEQAQPFNPQLHLGQLITELTPLTPQKIFLLRSSKGQTFHARCVIVASGMGAFLPRTLNLDGIKPLEHTQILYQLPTDHTTLQTQHVVISGDLEDTLQAANLLASQSDHRPASITLIHRRDKFRALDRTIERTQQLRQDGLLRFIAGQPKALITDTTSGRLTALALTESASQQTQHIPADTLLILHGLAPQISPIAKWGTGGGLATQGKQLVIDTQTFQTSTPGIFAIGDAITYPGKRNLIISSFHEATLAAYGAASYLNDGAPVTLQYTSSNSELQALLHP